MTLDQNSLLNKIESLEYSVEDLCNVLRHLMESEEDERKVAIMQKAIEEYDI